MKKNLTILTVFATLLSGMASADTLAPVHSLTSINIATPEERDISDLGLNTTDGYTLMITVDWTNRGNGTLLWLSNEAGQGANTASTSDNTLHSTATIGYSTGPDKQLAVTYGNGTATGGTHQAPASPVTVPSHTQPASTDISTILFLTVQSGTADLYEMTSDGSLFKTSTRSGYATGDVATLSVGNWNTSASVQQGTMDVAFFQGVLTTEQMGKLVPEPATATLSIFALAGLLARRRRK